MNVLKNILFSDTEFAHAAEGFSRGRTPMIINGLCDSVRPLFCAAFSDITNEKPLIIVPDEKQAHSLKSALEGLGEKCDVYLQRDFLFDPVTAYSKDFEQERLKVLHDVLTDGSFTLITVPDAVMQYTVPPETMLDSMMNLTLNMKYSPEELADRFVSMGYTFADTVEGKGQFSRRGGIVDVFSPSADYPCRIDYFGDVPDSMGIFDTITQRRIENVQLYACVPVCETVVSEEARSKCREAVSGLLKGKTESSVRAELQNDLELLNNNEFPPARDKYSALLYDRRTSIYDYIGNRLTIIFESRKVLDRAHAYRWEYDQTLETLCNSGRSAYPYADSLMTEEDFSSLISRKGVAIDYFMESSRLNFAARYDILTKSVGTVSGSAVNVADELSDWLNAGMKVLYVAHNEREAENLDEILVSREIPHVVLKEQSPVNNGVINIAVSEKVADTGGFELVKSNFVLMSSGGEIVRNSLVPRGRYVHKYKKAEKIASYSDLAVGDYIVHANHGIGIYAGLQQLTVEGATKDFIKINYAGGDVLYVPCGQLDLVSKYIGAENVKISKMGTSEWARTKAKAKASAKSIAKELIKLYAERKATPGHEFPPDDEYQEEFECMFDYEETDGQLAAAREIKDDMEKPQPMDRLLCGDVGFGKTEVALRAVFKCVSDGKQAAILVPTTILAMQHYRTMLSRFREFPVSIEMLSRFRTKKDSDETLSRLRSGKTDVVVGTHKLLQENVVFKDLGLLIVDEEQRFGVKHKEKLRQIAKNVDTLTLTATPIPRTLNMALTGIRDMSVLEEAPRDRAPVQSYVMEYDESILDEAIRRELRRGGQVFYLHNTVDSIYRKAADLQRRFPKAVIAVGHGQMSKDELSSVWQMMSNGDIDILVCTTIIETGVDIPNANTLIIEDADRMGLSQLHQIRGRVGRSPRKAYAYFTYRRDAILSETASKRLEAIREFTEFGSGFKIAMRDLEIRGAGNLLGAEQSGQMEAIGYDLYVKILEEAVNEEKGVEPAVKRECVMELNCDAYIPEYYVDSPKMRIDFYRKIALIESSADSDDLADEMLDRFGDIPYPVENLIDISLSRNIASGLGFAKIKQVGNLVSFYSETLSLELRKGVLSLPSMHGRILIPNTQKPLFSYRIRPGENVIERIRSVLEDFRQLLTK